MVTRKFGLLLQAVVAVCFSILITNPVHAASGTISVVPQNGEFSAGEVIEAQIRIDGGGTSFNAAKANVSVSEGLTVENLTLGDCAFAYVDTPTVAEPSFAGVILGGSSNACNAYTLTLRVTGQGSGFVHIADGSIKAHEGAIELLNSVNNSSYTFASSGNAPVNNRQISPTQPPLTSPEGQKLYTLVYTIDANTSSPGMEVVLDPDQPTQMITRVITHPDNPELLAAVFENVPEGVHTIAVRENGEVLSTEIVNVEGENREVVLGVEPNKAQLSLFNIALAAIVIVILVAGAILGFVFYKRRRSTP